MRLQHPLEIDGERVEEIALTRRAKARDFRDAARQARISGDDSDPNRELHLLANLCETSLQTIEELDMADYGVLQRELAGFLAR